MTEAIVQRMGCKVSLPPRTAWPESSGGIPPPCGSWTGSAWDFRNGSVISVLKQFGYKG